MDHRDELDGPIPRLPNQTANVISVSGLTNNQPINNNEGEFDEHNHSFLESMDGCSYVKGVNNLKKMAKKKV